MGTSYVKDENISIFVEIDKKYYTAGQPLKGCAYLIVKANSIYSNLSIFITGEEYVYWTEGSGRRKQYYSNTYESYKDCFRLYDFCGNVAQGQYSFPFTINLPKMMCGSFYQNQNCFIKYTLSAQLIHPKEAKKTQIFEQPLNILEPPRMPLKALSKLQVVASNCCYWCKSYGTTSTLVTCDKNFARAGDTLNVKLKIDNSKGKKTIDFANIHFEQKRVIIASDGTQRTRHQNQWLMYVLKDKLEDGKVKDYTFQFKIPPSLSHSTAIGRVTARYFLVRFKSYYGCCSNTAYNVQHIIIHSSNPEIIIPKKMPPPNNWNPHAFPHVIAPSLRPYKLNPLSGIPFHNLPKPKQTADPKSMAKLEQKNELSDDVKKIIQSGNETKRGLIN